ncbi:capsule assembly Wzi family protein [Spirosoma fluviale]|uniref:capsule assembly Wzi family protein n=1 Tax=Spirosoma fluviale TaxID=1597977 RepID=UPI001FEA185A|nr:capsule assembly Wzi family protein [Spirosoma fluviale]
MQYHTELGSYVATSGETPFWLRANQYGIVPQEAALMTFRQAVRVDYHDLPKTKLDSLRAVNRRIDWGWGAEAIFNAGYTYKLLIPEAYVKVKFGKALEAWAGRRREIMGLVDSTLTSGSYAWSGNTLPMLKIQLAISDYLPRHALIGLKGFYAHGWFEEDRFIKNSMLHQKALYGRFGKPNWRLKFYGGINHQVMWGGNTERLPGGVIKNNQLPNRFSDYIDVITGSSLGNRTNVDTNRVSSFDRENRIGNHLGTVDIGIDYIARHFSVFAYRQNIYEDGSLFHLTNLKDGLHGLRFRNRRPGNRSGFQLEQVLLEFLYTKSQGGALFLENNAQRGRDNYFNHSQYQDGWSRFGLTMGTPFITPTQDSRNELPQYGFTNNNRVAVMHVGLSGRAYGFLTVQARASYSENLGTYEIPFLRPIRQFSSVLSLSAPFPILNGITANASVATDFGDLYANNIGFYVGIRKEGRSRK